MIISDKILERENKILTELISIIDKKDEDFSKRTLVDTFFIKKIAELQLEIEELKRKVK